MRSSASRSTRRAGSSIPTRNRPGGSSAIASQLDAAGQAHAAPEGARRRRPRTLRGSSTAPAGRSVSGRPPDTPVHERDGFPAWRSKADRFLAEWEAVERDAAMVPHLYRSSLTREALEVTADSAGGRNTRPPEQEKRQQRRRQDPRPQRGRRDQAVGMKRAACRGCCSGLRPRPARIHPTHCLAASTGGSHFGIDEKYRPPVRLRFLRTTGRPLPTLRPRPCLLLQELRRDGAPEVAAPRRAALPEQPPGPAQACAAPAPLSRTP